MYRVPTQRRLDNRAALPLPLSCRPRVSVWRSSSRWSLGCMAQLHPDTDPLLLGNRVMARRKMKRAVNSDPRTFFAPSIDGRDKGDQESWSVADMPTRDEWGRPFSPRVRKKDKARFIMDRAEGAGYDSCFILPRGTRLCACLRDHAQWRNTRRLSLLSALSEGAPFYCMGRQSPLAVRGLSRAEGCLYSRQRATDLRQLRTWSAAWMTDLSPEWIMSTPDSRSIAH